MSHTEGVTWNLGIREQSGKDQVTVKLVKNGGVQEKAGPMDASIHQEESKQRDAEQDKLEMGPEAQRETQKSRISNTAGVGNNI